MHPFPVGTRVETNEEYFKTFGRRVIGTSEAMNPMPPNHVTIVRWEFQEGKIIPEHTGNKVLMMSKDLQKYEILCANCGGREVEEEGDFCDNCLE